MISCLSPARRNILISKSTTTAICGYVPAMSCQTIQVKFTGMPEIPSIRMFPIAGSVRWIILSTLKAASKKSFPFTVNATDIFMKLRNTGLINLLKNYREILLIPVPVRTNAYNFRASVYTATGGSSAVCYWGL